MQIDNKEYNPELHEQFCALTVKQPYANDLVTLHREDEDGTRYGYKTIEVRSRKTSYRGDILICSSKAPVFPYLPSGVTLGVVELYDVKPISEFTEEDWQSTRIPIEKRKQIKKGYGWLMRNPRKVIEYPVSGQLGIYRITYTKGDIQPYPENVSIDDKAWKKMQKNKK